MATLPFKDTVITHREEIARRWALAAEPCPDDACGPRWQLMLREFLWPIEPLRRLVGPPLEIPAAQTPKTVMLLPGFGAHPIRMRWMARKLEKAGHITKKWGLGYNFGATQARFQMVERRLVDIYRRTGTPI